MIGRQGQNVVFLLCVPRSGSSMATVMLQNHSKVFASQEMWFLMSLYELRYRANQPPYGGSEILKQFYHGVLSDEMYEDACRQFALQVYNSLLHSSGTQIVVDKSPRYYAVLEFLDRLFPQSRRIWLIRNPLSILSSYKKVGSWPRGDMDIADRLRSDKFDVKIADLTVGFMRYAQYFSKENPYAYRLSYEQLAAHPEEELRKVCQFIGVDYEEGQHKYGNPKNSTKADLFYSMGVGDPFLSSHVEPHTQSIDSWKEILDKKEAEAYCRILGARSFRSLGYGDALEEVERWTGTRFEQEPDQQLLQQRTRQFMEHTGFVWKPSYRIQHNEEESVIDSSTSPELITEVNGRRSMAANHTELQQLKMAVRALERRLEASHADRDKLREELRSTKQKIARIKSMIPFGNRLSHLASAYLKQGGRKS
ncbi:sulfotransferase family protein [Marinicrinis lubricantis]|uniref:Sulfotransferase family protein n=1 Tax=Marinicrinis lubricantis TaxID=2086470 RepID=A0ABW1IK33_9BACL